MTIGEQPSRFVLGPNTEVGLKPPVRPAPPAYEIKPVIGDIGVVEGGRRGVRELLSDLLQKLTQMPPGPAKRGLGLHIVDRLDELSEQIDSKTGRAIQEQIQQACDRIRAGLSIIPGGLKD